MAQSSPFITFSNNVLWLKAILTAATLVVLYLRYKRGTKPEGVSQASYKAHPVRTRVAVGCAVLLACAAFYDLGTFRGGSFVHYGEMFHYYLGSKYFKELGYYELYNAVIVADAEQDNLLASLPFYTDLKTYRNVPRATALRDGARVKSLFSEARWNAFKDDVAYFEAATGMPRSRGLMFLLMDHGYNASPVSTFLLAMLTNAVPVSQLHALAALDVLVLATLIVLVFHSFGLAAGALFSVYFFVNILSGHEYISGSLLRYDWLLYIVAAVCLLDSGRHAASAFFLTLSAMLRVFPVVLFYGIAVTIVQKVKATRKVDRQSVRFVVAAAATALALFVLPAVSLGSVLRPWHDFLAKASLHDSGVYVNHLGLRGIVLFEPSHLSLEEFATKYQSADIVRHWEDVKEQEFARKRPIIFLASLVVVLGLTAIIWNRKESGGASLLWSALLIYTVSYLSTYYYAFLCLFVLLFFRRSRTSDGFVPLCLLLLLNLAALATDYFKPSPIVFFTLVNVYLFVCLSSILAFELYVSVFRSAAVGTVAGARRPPGPSRDVGRRRRQSRTRSKR